MVRDFLDSLAITVLEASNAAEAIHIARSHPGQIDLLLTDLERDVGLGVSKQNRCYKARHSHSLYVLWDWPTGMDRLQEKAAWYFFYSKAVSVEGIKGAPDGYFFGLRNGPSVWRLDILDCEDF
jgi:hypothetical protein